MFGLKNENAKSNKLIMNTLIMKYSPNFIQYGHVIKILLHKCNIVLATLVPYLARGWHRARDMTSTVDCFIDTLHFNIKSFIGLVKLFLLFVFALWNTENYIFDITLPIGK